jgi:hypothetical protein
MRRSLPSAVFLLTILVAGARPADAWVNGGLGIVYGGPYAYAAPCPPPVAYWPPAYYPPPAVAYWPPAYYPPPAVAYWPPAYTAPPGTWPSYGPDVAVRWKRYFTPDGPRVQGYTLPR